MAGQFERRPFSDIDLSDSFFDSLKSDYPEFAETWFPKCAAEGREALVFSDEDGLGAFIAMKYEMEPVALVDNILPARPRLKVSTMLLASRFRGQRLGEGALGLILWEWQASTADEVYLTVFPSHSDLISQVEKFGFNSVGENERGEIVFLRSRNAIDYSDPYKSFPYISPNFSKGGYLIVEDEYHDTLFPYSELRNTFQEQLARDAANGMSKVYIGRQWAPHYQVGEPIFIYRKYSGPTAKRYRSCVTSYCVATSIVAVKRYGRPLLSYDRFLQLAGNRTVFTEAELRHRYDNDKNITLIQMLYCGYFGEGNNINMDWLDKNSLWTKDDYPASRQLSRAECETIWRKAGKEPSNVYGG